MRIDNDFGFHSLVAASVFAHIAILAAAPHIRTPQLNVRSERISVSVRAPTVPSPPVLEAVKPEPVSEVVPEPAPAKPKPMAKVAPQKPVVPVPVAAPDASREVNESVARVIDTEPVPWSRNRPPIYPQSAQRAGQEGTVLLKLLVLASGKVGNVTTLRSSGVITLDEAARKAAALYRFTPASRAGLAVEYEATIPFEFELARHSRSSRH